MRALRLILPLLLCAAGLRAQVVPVERVVAAVNDRVIMSSDVMGMIAPAEQELRARHKGDRAALDKALQELYEKGMNVAVERALILEDFKASKAELPELAVHERLASIVKTRFGGDRNALLLELSAQRKTLEQLRNEIRDDITIQMMKRQEIGDKATASPADLRRLYEERRGRYETPERLRARMVSIRKEGRTPEEIATRVEAVKAALAAGKAFELIANEYSDFAKEKGGDLGTVARKDLRPDFQKALASLAPGQSAGPLDSESEIAFLHLLQVLPATTRSMEDALPELERELKRKAEDSLYQAWVQRLRIKHTVVLYAPTDTAAKPAAAPEAPAEPPTPEESPVPAPVSGLRLIDPLPSPPPPPAPPAEPLPGLLRPQTP